MNSPSTPLSISDKLKALELTLKETQEALAFYKQKSEESTQTILTQAEQIKLLESQARNLRRDLQEKDQNLQVLSHLPSKIKELESERQFLKRRIEVLISTSKPKVKEPTTPTSASDNYLSLDLKNKSSTPNSYSSDHITNFTVSSNRIKQGSKTIPPSHQSKNSSGSSAMDQISIKEKEISDLISSLSTYKRLPVSSASFKPPTDPTRLLNRVLTNPKIPQV